MHMTVLDANITLMGNLAHFNHDDFEIEALNFLFDRLLKGNLLLEGAELYIGAQPVRHYTWRDKGRNRTCSMFFTYGNTPPHLSVYGLGKHHGDSDKEYSLYTWIDKKEQLYTLAPERSDSRFRSLLSK
jgi:hypothetical protein